MKNVIAAALLLALFACNEPNNKLQRTGDSTALEAIDSSAIMNDSTRLPQDSLKTTVAH